MTAPAAAHRESWQVGVVATRIKDLERKLGEAQKELNKLEEYENGKAQTSPTAEKGEDAGNTCKAWSGQDQRSRGSGAG